MLLHASNIFELTFNFTFVIILVYKIAVNTNFTARDFFISISRKSQSFPKQKWLQFVC